MRVRTSARLVEGSEAEGDGGGDDDEREREREREMGGGNRKEETGGDVGVGVNSAVGERKEIVSE